MDIIYFLNNLNFERDNFTFLVLRIMRYKKGMIKIDICAFENFYFRTNLNEIYFFSAWVISY